MYANYLPFWIVAVLLVGTCHASGTSLSDTPSGLEHRLAGSSPPHPELSESVLSRLLDVLHVPDQPMHEREAAARILDHTSVNQARSLPPDSLIDFLDRLHLVPADLRWYTGRLLVYASAAHTPVYEHLMTLSAGHPEPDVRYFAARILTAAGPHPEDHDISFRHFMDLHAADADASVREAALRYIETCAYTDKRAVDLFVRLLRNTDPSRRFLAARALEKSGEYAGDALPHLLDLLSAEDGYPAIRAQAWRALRSVGGDDPRIAGPQAPRSSGSGDMVPGLEQRLDAGFRSSAESDRFTFPDSFSKGEALFSTRGWRGGEMQIPAFPGAQGFGKWTPGGRGGEVYHVTSLGDDGPGTLRDAVSESHRIIVFDVSGIIELEEQLDIEQPFITIAGQTAPGRGITVSGSRTQISANDIILRHLRFRPGDESGQRDKAINVTTADNIIIDHLSTSWAKEETMSVVHSGRVTIQNSLITHGLVDAGHYKGDRGYGSLIRGAGPGNRDYAQGSNYSFINNLWAHQRSRAPRPGNYLDHQTDPVGPVFDFRNNVFYNWGGNRSGDNFDDHSISRYNFIGNYYKPGPDSDGHYAFYEESPYAMAYWRDNAMAGAVPDDQSQLILGLEEIPGDYLQPQPFHAGDYGITLSARESYYRVLERSGAHPRDHYDRNVIEEVRTGGGTLIDSHTETVGFPHHGRALPPVDTGGNSMPDWWLIRHGIHPETTLNPDGDFNRSGYTNIEEYLNGTSLDLFYQAGSPAKK
ncbi:HEAT repeat domain-containing protein [Balneolales bacterium ANBcel1]|nr:HEAT repeat domain-containing protein [Balneolales bacterium ANBcel1]